MSKRHLPVLVEHSLGALEAARIDLAARFSASHLGGPNPTTCRSGCSNCCYHPVTISILEGTLLYRHLKKEGLFTSEMRKHLQHSSDTLLGASYAVWLLSVIACPLLDGDKCTAYSARPFVCRTTISTGDPHYCHPHQLGENTKIADRIEVVQSFHEVETKILRGHRLDHLLVPVGTSVLVGERISEGQLEISRANKDLIFEYVGKA